jgi:hypothetical protein
MGHRAGLDTEVTEKILCLCRGSNPDRPDITQCSLVKVNRRFNGLSCLHYQSQYAPLLLRDYTEVYPRRMSLS